MNESPLFKDFLNLIERELETSWHYLNCSSDVTIVEVDLSIWRLRFSSETPFILVSVEEIKNLGQKRIIDIVRQELIVRSFAPATVIILVEGDGSFLQGFGNDPFWSPIFDSQIITKICKHSNPKKLLIETFLSSIPLKFLSPYEANSEATGSRFYGRDLEKGRIIYHPMVSYAIVGGRRIGKTSLLKEVIRIEKQQHPSKDSKRIIWYDFWGYRGNEEAFYVEIVRHFGEGFPRLIKPNFADYFPRFLRDMVHKHGGQLLFVIDEVDDLIDYERKHGFSLLNVFKKIMDEYEPKSCRVLIAGFRVLSEELSRHDTPLRFCEPIHLGNLTVTAAKAMLNEPMSSMGISFENDALASILHDTGGHPYLIQLFGQAIVEILDEQNEKVVTMDHVCSIKQKGRLYEDLIDSLIENTSDLEFALIVEMVNKNIFSYETIDETLKQNEIDLPTKEIYRICRNLEAIGILSKSGENSYQFAVPLQPALASSVAAKELLWRKARRHYIPGE